MFKHVGFVVALVFLISHVKGGNLSAIVGDITTREARILFWKYTDISATLETYDRVPSYCSISLFPPVSSMAFLMIEATEQPKIVELSGLSSNKDYTMKFHCANEPSEPTTIEKTIEFRTQSEDIPNSANYTGEILFYSCNRQADEPDEEMWNLFKQTTNQLSENRKKTNKTSKGTLIFHMGDQIYADQVKNIMEQKRKEENKKCITYLDILLEYRKIYTKTWNSTILESILSKYSNRMLLDDHDIINNLNELKWMNKNDSLQISSIRAGVQSFLEFQYQLISDIPSFDFIEHSKESLCCLSFDDEDSKSQTNLCAKDNKWREFDEKIESLKLYNKKVIGNIGILTLDTRAEQSFSNYSTPEVKLFSKDQLHFVNETLKQWNENVNIHSVLIVSSIPIVYQSSFMSEIAFIAEGERYSTHNQLIGNTGDILDIFFTFPSKISIVSGDIHMFLNSEICRSSDGICITQLVSSGMHKKSSTIRSLHLYLYAFFAIHVFTPYVYSSNDEYYLKVSQVFLDNSFIQFSYDNLHGSWLVFKREINDSFLNLLEIFFENPVIYYFVFFCALSNFLFLLFTFFLIVYRRKKMPPPKKQKSE